MHPRQSGKEKAPVPPCDDRRIPPHLQKGFVFQTAGTVFPQGIYFGFGSVGRVGDLARKLGKTRALLVTDSVMVDLGYAGRVADSLKEAGLKVESFSGVEPEPEMSTAETLREQVRGGDFDLVIGLGGGSALDMAKLTSLVATNDASPFEWMSKKKPATRPGLTKILIPTTSGTGSEVSRYVVVSAGKEKYGSSSPFVYADVAIIDPELTVSMPGRITAITGLDALSHGIDAAMNKYELPFFDSLAYGGIELISRYLRRATRDGGDLEARYYMAMGSMMSMMAMDGKGVALYSHSISYVLAAFHPVPHGLGCGLALPYTMAANLPSAEDRLARMARSMGQITEPFSPGAAARKAVRFVRGLLEELGLPVSLKEMGFQKEDLPSMAEMCLTRYKREYNPRDLTPEEMRAIFEGMWQGEVDLGDE